MKKFLLTSNQALFKTSAQGLMDLKMGIVHYSRRQDYGFKCGKRQTSDPTIISIPGLFRPNHD